VPETEIVFLPTPLLGLCFQFQRIQSKGEERDNC